MSPFYFSRQVKPATGKTFLEFVTAYRIQRAKQRLLSTELPISDIGRAVGYPDSARIFFILLLLVFSYFVP